MDHGAVHTRKPKRIAVLERQLRRLLRCPRLGNGSSRNDLSFRKVCQRCARPTTQRRYACAGWKNFQYLRRCRVTFYSGMHCCPRCKLLCCEPTVRTKTTRGRQSWNCLSQRQASWRPLLRGFLAGCRGHSPSGTPSSVRVGWKKSKTLLRFQQREHGQRCEASGPLTFHTSEVHPAFRRPLARVDFRATSFAAFLPEIGNSISFWPSIRLRPRLAVCLRPLCAARSVRCGAVHPSG